MLAWFGTQQPLEATVPVLSVAHPGFQTDQEQEQDRATKDGVLVLKGYRTLNPRVSAGVWVQNPAVKEHGLCVLLKSVL